jgi:hypothetical protein
LCLYLVGSAWLRGGWPNQHSSSRAGRNVLLGLIANIDPLPYFGWIKGTRQTLQQRAAAGGFCCLRSAGCAGATTRPAPGLMALPDLNVPIYMTTLPGRCSSFALLMSVGFTKSQRVRRFIQCRFRRHGGHDCVNAGHSEPFSEDQVKTLDMDSHSSLTLTVTVTVRWATARNSGCACGTATEVRYSPKPGHRITSKQQPARACTSTHGTRALYLASASHFTVSTSWGHLMVTRWCTRIMQRRPLP